MTLFGLFAVAVPKDASAMTCNSATLTGNVITGTPPARARFEYSTSQSAVSNGQGITTTVQTFYSDGPIQQFVSGLTESTNYYYRLAVTNNYGTIYTTLSSFTTPACPINSPAPTVSISANPSSVAYGGSSTIIWNSNNATSCTGTGGTGGWAGAQPLNHSFSVGPLTSTATYGITCTNDSGVRVSGSTTVTVGSQQQNQRPTISLNGSSSININVGQSYNDAGATANDPEEGNITSRINVSGYVNTNSPGTYTLTYNVSDSQGLSANPVSRTVTVSAVQQNMTGTLSPSNPSCVIPSGQSTCQVSLTWNTLSPVGVSSITKSPNNTILATGNSGTKYFAVSYPDTTFYLYNNSQLLDTSTATASCAYGTTWNGNTCQTPSPTTCQDHTAINYGGALPCQYQIAQPTVNLTSDSSNVSYNGSTTIRWNSTNATSCNGTGGTNGWNGPKSTSSSNNSFFTGNLTNAVTFHITCTNSSGTDSDSVTVNVGNQQVQAPSVTISANPTNLSYNGTSTISWSSTDASSCNGSGGINGWSGTKALYGNFNTGAMTGTRTFSITCSNSTGSDNASVTVNVSNQQIINPSVTIYADDSDIDEDDSTTVRWTSNNANSCSASGGANGWAGNKALSGSFFTGSLTSDKTFSITCTNAQGSDSAYVTINVDEDNGSSGNVSVDISANDTSIDEGDNVRITWDSDNADECETVDGTSEWRRKNIGTSGSFTTEDLDNDETFKIECSNDDGDTDTDSVTIRVSGDSNSGDRPNVDITADRTVINSGQITTIRWDVDDADDCYASGGTNGWSGSKNRSSGTFSTGPMYGSATFFLDCGNDEGNESDSVTVQVVSTPVITQPPQTIYVPGPTPAPIIRNTTTYINNGGGTARPLVELTIDGGDDSIRPGDERIYQVEWRNISNQTLRKVALRIVLPESMTFENTNRGSYTSRDNTITLDISELRPNETGDMLFTARTKTTIRNNQLIVVVANMVYTDNSDNQGDVVAYATHHVDLGGSVLGANAFYAGFLPTTLLGWLFFLILLLILLSLVRYLYGQSNPRHVMVTDNIHHH